MPDGIFWKCFLCLEKSALGMQLPKWSTRTFSIIAASTRGIIRVNLYHSIKAHRAKAMDSRKKASDFLLSLPGTFSEIDEQGAAAAQVKEKNVQPLKIHDLRRYNMMEKTTGHGRGHYYPQSNSKMLVQFVPAESLVSPHCIFWPILCPEDSSVPFPA